MSASQRHSITSSNAMYPLLGSILLLSTTHGFTARPAAIVPSRSALKAQIYGDFENGSSSSYSFYPELEVAAKVRNQELMDAITNSDDSVAMLARLSKAFASSVNHNIEHLHHLQQVSLLDVDDSKMSMQAVMCDDMNCVTLHIPVEFPQSCFNSENMEECVLGNVLELDEVAKKHCAHLEMIANNHEDLDHIQREKNMLLREDDIDFPEWWVQPDLQDKDMQKECATLRTLLNEDCFQEDLLGLVDEQLTMAESKECVVNYDDNSNFCTAQQVSVGAVGPAGIVFRCILDMPTARVHDYVQDHGPAVASHQRYFCDIPMSFGFSVIASEALRNTVLDIFEQ